MVRLFKTTDVPPSSATDRHHVYNGMDCCVTLEVFEAIAPQLDEVTTPVYRNAFELQAPILEMQLRGVKIDKPRVADVRAKLSADLARMEIALNELMTEGLGLPPINPHSWQQVGKLVYGDMGLPVVRKKGKPTTDRSALEKLSSYFYAEPIVNHIITCKELKKKIGVLSTGIDPDGRMRASYNICGTDTGRMSSYECCFGSGTNQQNITEELRPIFVTDKGMKGAYIDFEQIQSRAVGATCWNLFGESKYLDACESGDLHTAVVKMTWQELAWGSVPDRELADLHFYRVDSYRQAAKKLGHATNFYGKAKEISRQTRIPELLVSDFQLRYFQSFPEIPAWHKETKAKLIRDGWITALTGRRRWFFGRRFDDDTLKQALAYYGQAIESEFLRRAIMNIHREIKAGLPVQLLIPVHDALFLQYPEEQEDELLPKLKKLMEIEIPLMNGRSFIVPVDAAVGWNWAYASESNKDGLKKYKGHDPRKRSEILPLMDRKFS